MSENIYVTKSVLPDYEEYTAEIKSIWDSHLLTNMGPKHEELRKQLKTYLSVDKIDLLTNGHMALELSLQAFDFPEGGEVITTPFTFASTTHAIARNGLVPVFCDINPIDFTMDVSLIEDLITEKTVAIMPVHVYGNVCDVEEIERIAVKHGLKVIYDAAHSFGETYKGEGIGSFGDVSCFSFHATKVYNTIEGGAVCFKDEAFGKRLYQLKNFGIKDEVTVDGVGANAKMNEFCAAMGICNLRHIDEVIAARKRIVEKYRDGFRDIEGIYIVPEQDGVESNYSYFPIVIDPDAFGKTRDDIYEALMKDGVYARKYFYPLTNEFECYREKFDAMFTPIARNISERVLTLPLYPELEMEDVKRIINLIQAIYSKKRME